MVVLDDLSSGHREFVPRRRAVRRGHRSSTPSLLERRPAGARRRRASCTWPASSTPASRSSARCTPTSRTSPARSTCSRRWSDTGVDKMVFSSSAATFGTPDVDLVTEETATRPESPYGESKLIGEWLLRDQGRARAAAHVAALLQRRRLGHRRGLRHQPAQPVPARVRGAARGRDARGSTATTTPPPTAPACATTSTSPTSPTAHVAAAQALPPGDALEPVYNLGSGDGLRSREIMDAMARVTGIDFTPESRRAARATRPGSWRPASSPPATSTGRCGTPSTTWCARPGRRAARPPAAEASNPRHDLRGPLTDLFSPRRQGRHRHRRLLRASASPSPRRLPRPAPTSFSVPAASTGSPTPQGLVEAAGRRALAVATDVAYPEACQRARRRGDGRVRPGRRTRQQRRHRHRRPRHPGDARAVPPGHRRQPQRLLLDGAGVRPGDGARLSRSSTSPRCSA